MTKNIVIFFLVMLIISIVLLIAMMILYFDKFFWLALIVPIGIFLPLLEFTFRKHTKLYPKNKLIDYKFSAAKSPIGFISEGYYSIEIYEQEKGIWLVNDKKNKLIFNMSGYILPKQYICAYFIRTIHYVVMNRNRYPLYMFFKQMNLEKFDKYNRLELIL